MFTLEKESMELLLFAYGLSFFALGISVLFARPKESEYFFSCIFWLLGVFAISHAFEDWISLFKYLHPHTSFSLLDYFQSFLLLASYVFLFEFSRFIIRKSFVASRSKLKKHLIYTAYNAPAIYTFATLGLLFLVFLHPTVSGINAAIRYTYGFWGALILGLGLYYYGDSLTETQNINRLKLYFKMSGIAFVFYALFSGIIVDPISYFPGNWLNTQTFMNAFHFPVQAFRGLAALVITIASIKALDLFKYELIAKLNESYENIKNFSSNASHQIKTPLTSLRLQIHVALKKNKTLQEYKETLHSIDSETVLLQEMVEKLLLLSRIQNRGIRENFQTVHLDDILLETFEEYSIVAKSKGVILEIESIEYSLIQAEPTLLKILFANLIDNAIKFTPKGKKVSLSLSQSSLTITDEGVGIPKQKLPRIFDEFYRVTSPAKEPINGYGLGLSMVKKIAEIHQFKLKVFSEPGEGTQVIVTF